MRLGLAVAVFSLATSAVAGDFSLGMPLDCTLGDDCFVQQYVDRDPTENYRDFTCGGLSYDGHKGTDFALHSFEAMRAGVSVVAAGKGVVSALRDGQADTGAAGMTPGKECGNGVVIDHPNGWQTQYCHLMKGSVQVRQSQTVRQGQALGLVGFSGRTAFPHVHITVRKDGDVVDPFDPSNAPTCSNLPNETLWQEDIAYRPGGLISVGISDAIPTFEAIKDGSASDQHPSVGMPALVLYAYGFGARSEDLMEFYLTGPDGVIVQQETMVETPQAQFFRAVGRKRSDSTWPAGTYEGSVLFKRGEQIVDRKTLRFSLP